MKKGILILVAFVALLGCSKENEDSPSMRAKIDGVDWNAVTRVSVLSNNKFIITGTSTTGQSISITVFGIAEGTYQLDISSLQCEALYKQSINASTDDAFFAYNGTVLLTSVDTSARKISGAYNFMLRRTLTGASVTITDGTFKNLKYTVDQ